MNFEEQLKQMELAILEDLKKLQPNYGKMKFAISRDTGIPIDILTVLLKRLKYEQKVELMMIWSEETYRPDGSGYCLSGNNNLNE